MLLQAIRGTHSFAAGRVARRFLASAPRPPTTSALHAELANGQDYVGGLVYDFETTSANPSSTEPVQMAVMCVNSKLPNPPMFVRYVLPAGPIEPGAEAVHGISRDVLLAQQAQPFSEVYAELREWLGATFGEQRPLVWTAHNGQRFDEPILRRLAGQPLPTHWRFHDTLLAAQEVVEGGRRPWGKGQFTLGRLFLDATGSPLEGAHDAAVDCSALASVWKWLVAQEQERGSSSGDGMSSDGKALFQAHLQTLGYAPAGSQQRAAKSPPGGWAKPFAAGARTPAKAPRAAKGPAAGASEVVVKAARLTVAVDVATAPLSALPGVGPAVEAKLSATLAWVSASCAVSHFRGPACGGDASVFKAAITKALQKRAAGQPPPVSQVSARTAAKRLAEFCEAHRAALPADVVAD